MASEKSFIKQTCSFKNKSENTCWYYSLIRQIRYSITCAALAEVREERLHDALLEREADVNLARFLQLVVRDGATAVAVEELERAAQPGGPALQPAGAVSDAVSVSRHSDDVSISLQ